MRALAAAQGDLAKRLAELENKTEALAMNQYTFSCNVRNQLKQVFDALRELMATTPEPSRRPIGLVNTDDKGSKGKARSRTYPLQPSCTNDLEENIPVSIHQRKRPHHALAIQPFGQRARHIHRQRKRLEHHHSCVRSREGVFYDPEVS